MMNMPATLPARSFAQFPGLRLMCLLALTACLSGCAGYEFQFANTAAARERPSAGMGMDPAQRARINEIYVF